MNIKGIFLALALIILPSTISAQHELDTEQFAGMQCAPREEVVTVLHRAGESRREVGLTMNGKNVYEFWGSDSGGTWTIIRTYILNNTMISCMMAVGKNYEHQDDHKDYEDLGPEF